MLQQYIIEGLALGAIYAIASASLVVTFVSAGVLNFGFAAMAYVVARFYYWLNTQHGWSSIPSACLSLLVFAPLLGVALYGGLFRFVRGKSQLVKLVTTIGVLVTLPAASNLIFGNQAIEQAPGLAGFRVQTYHLFSTPITANDVMTFAFLLFVVIVGTALLRFTDLGLKVRALVDSEAMASLSGTNPGRVSMGVWAVTTTLAGLAGILLVPTQNLDISTMTALMAAAFAAVVAARLRSLAGAVVVSLAMGVVTDVIQKYLPQNSPYTPDIITSVPFGIILVFLLYYVVRTGGTDVDVQAGGPLDLAIRPANQDPENLASQAIGRTGVGAALGAIPMLVVAALPLIFHGSSYWLALTAGGLCFSITFLTFTVVTGEGGMLWLSQPIFAGAGALATAQFTTVWHIPVLLAIGLGGVVAAVAGAILGTLTIRLGNLYVGLVTFSFGLLAETLIFTRNRFSQGGLGVDLNRPGFAGGDLAFAYLALGVFLVFALLIVNLRRSTSGLALRAVRDSEPAARTIGLSVLQVKVIVGALAAFVAAVGGGFIALNDLVAQPQSYSTFGGLVWLAVVATMGIRSITAAALAGLSLSLLAGVFTTYVPARWGDVPTILFGLGAVSVARNPEGVIVQNGRQVRALLAGLLARRGQPGVPGPATPKLPSDRPVKAKAAG